MVKKYKIFIFILVLLVLISLGFFYFYTKQDSSKDATSDSTKKEKTQEDSETTDEASEKIILPKEYDLKIPFVPQAPFGVWDDLHNNACEETALLLVHYYYQGLNLNREKADTEIRAMVDFEIRKYGTHKNLTIIEVADLAREFYSYQDVRLEYDFSWKDLKKEIMLGHPVIVPLAGRLLYNPYFRPPGPIYHMFIIRGYTDEHLVTNDVGTKRGESYRYTYEILDSALHDWTGNPNTITSGRRVMLVIKK